MDTQYILDFVPTWGIFLISVMIIFIAFEGGFRFGKYRRQSSQNELNAPLSSILGPTLGLLAFTLAFTFGLAVSRFQDRRILVIDDANAIETTYRRAEFLSEPNKTEIRDLLRNYVSIRMPSANPMQLQLAIKQSEELQNQLWSQAVIVAKNNSNSIMAGLFIKSLNEMIDLHAKRIMIGARTRIPEMIWGVLLLVTIFSMSAIGYYSGLQGARSFIINLAMIFTFSGVIFLIADLDSPQSGFLTISQQPMTDVLKKML